MHFTLSVRVKEGKLIISPLHLSCQEILFSLWNSTEGLISRNVWVYGISIKNQLAIKINSMEIKDWRFKAVSVTKYNPLFFKDGIYQNDEWIGFFQIGEIFKGKKFEYVEYTKIEDNYVNFVIKYLEYNFCKEIIIRNLEKKELDESLTSNDPILKKLYNELLNDTKISAEKIRPIIQLILRDCIWCELFCTNDEDIFLRFGYDFYMYINSPINSLEVSKLASNFGLYLQ